MKNLFVMAALIAAMTSCSDDDKTPVQPQQTVLVTKERTADGDFQMGIREFTFDAANRLTSELTESYTITYTWNADGKISKMSKFNGTNTRETTYVYDATGQLVSEEERVTSSNALIDRHEYSYFADHYLDKYYDSSNQLWNQYKYYYDSAKKNITECKMFNASNNYSGKLIYTSDDKPSVQNLAPYSQLPAPFRNVNNRINIKEYTQSNELMESVDFVPEINTMGYPLAIMQGSYATTYEYMTK